MKVHVVRPEYVEQLPEWLDEGVLYVCEEFALTAHKCCCGCGEDVYNKLSPAKWRLIKMPDGSVSLYPSVGNWNYACQSHYWIDRNRVTNAGPMSAQAIKVVQKRDRRDRDRHIDRLSIRPDPNTRQRMNPWERVRSIAGRALRQLRRLWPS